MMWTWGYLDEDIAYEAKVFARPSGWGIGNGRASKLYIYRKEENGWEMFYMYERGSITGEIDRELLLKVLEKVDPPTPMEIDDEVLKESE